MGQEASLDDAVGFRMSKRGCNLLPPINMANGRITIPAWRCLCIRSLQHRRHRSWSFIETARPSLLECGLRRGDTKTFTSPPHSAHCRIPQPLPLRIFGTLHRIPSKRFLRFGVRRDSTWGTGSEASNLSMPLMASLLTSYERERYLLNSARDVPRTARQPNHWLMYEKKRKTSKNGERRGTSYEKISCWQDRPSWSCPQIFDGLWGLL